MQLPSIQSENQGSQAESRSATFWRGVLVGGVPLALLAEFLAGTLLVMVLARALTAFGGFFVQQGATLIVLAAGGVLTAAIYVTAIIWAWRRMREWFQIGASAPIKGALAALAATALLVALPVILAVLLPQHPAP